MPMWIVYFCSAFVGFFALGGYEEYMARRELTEDTYITQVAAAYFLHPEDVKDTHRSFSKAGYQYWCRGEVAAVYSPTTNTISLNQHRDYSGPATKAELTDLEIITLITGVSAAEIITQIRVTGGLSKAQLAGAVVGAVSGYNLGRWAFSRTRPSCSAEELTRRLGAPAFGAQLGREMLRQTLDRYYLVASAGTQPLVSQVNLAKLSEFAAKMPVSQPTWIPWPGHRPGAFLILPQLNSLSDLDAVCDSVRALVTRLSRSNYEPQSDDFDIAIYPHFIAKWLAYNSAAARQVYPGFRGIQFTRDPTEDPRLAWIRQTRGGPLRWIAYGLYGLMILVGVFVVLVGSIGIYSWVKRVIPTKAPEVPSTN